VTIDTWATMTPAEITEMRGRLDNALRKLVMLQQDVTRLEQRNIQLERELRRVGRRASLRPPRLPSQSSARCCQAGTGKQGASTELES
jgi:hypothetical protein